MPSAPSVGAQKPVSAQGDTVVINCPEQVELEVMVDYVGKTLGLRFLYGEELKNQRVELRPSPVEVPRKHLLSLLVSLLRVRDLALVEESPEFYRIVRAEQGSRSVSAIEPAGPLATGEVPRMVTQVLAVPSGQVEGLSDKLGRFMSSPKGNLIPVPEKGLLIVTDYDSRIALLQELISILDTGPTGIDVETIELTGGDPTVVATRVSAILTETHRLRLAKTPPPAVRGDILPGAVVIIGTDQQIQEAKALVQRLSPTDVKLSTQTYSPTYLSVERARSLIDNVVLAPGSGLPAPAAIHQDPQSGRLFITAEGPTHAAIAALLHQEDRPLPEPQRPLRIYRPRNRKAGELLATLSQLLGETTGFTAIDEPAARTSASDRFRPVGRNRQTSPAGIGQVPPVPPVTDPLEDKALAGQSRLRVQGTDYVLTVDEHTNSILAIGTREFHAQLEALIGDLDQRRPQVLIEMTLVAITMSDSIDLGVELQALDLGDAWDYLIFSNFGLSSIDVATGRRVLTPGVGANGVILSPEEVPILFHALATRASAHTLSTPKLLVSDNARGTLRNVEEAPFTSVNASDTVATTSFAGFESAGTTLSVTPHILQGDHLTLEYELTFSNFTGSSASAAVPPPRTTNSFTSTVEVPDGHTVVTGGLVVHNDSDAISEVPLLGRIPGLGKLFQSRSRQKTKTKIFAFIRPLILRDDRFAELKLITLKDTESAELLSDAVPPGTPQWMR